MPFDGPRWSSFKHKRTRKTDEYHKVCLKRMQTRQNINKNTLKNMTPNTFKQVRRDHKSVALQCDQMEKDIAEEWQRLCSQFGTENMLQHDSLARSGKKNLSKRLLKKMIQREKDIFRDAPMYNYNPEYQQLRSNLDQLASDSFEFMITDAQEEKREQLMQKLMEDARVASISNWRQSNNLLTYTAILPKKMKKCDWKKMKKRNAYHSSVDSSDPNMEVDVSDSYAFHLKLEQGAEQFLQRILDGIDDKYALPINQLEKKQLINKFVTSSQERTVCKSMITSLTLNNGVLVNESDDQQTKLKSNKINQTKQKSDQIWFDKMWNFVNQNVK